MGVKGLTKRVTDTSTWSASADLTAINLPRDALITEVTIRANITATLTATAYDDWFRRVIQNIKIEGDGGRAFLGMSGDQMSRVLSLWGEVLFGMPTLHSNGAGIALASPDVDSTSFISVFKFHPGSNPRDPFDLTAAIPAKALSTLQAKLTTTAAAVTDTNGNITAGTFRYEVNEVLDVDVPPGLMVPQGSTFTWAHDANYSDYSKDIDIPAGAYLRSIIILVQDHTATVSRRKDDEIAGVKIKKPRQGEMLLEQNFYELKQAMCARYGFRGTAGDVGPIGAIATTRPAPGASLSIVPAGFVVIDLRPYGHPLYGLNLTGLQSGDYKLGLTVENYTSGDDTIIYWDQVAPVESQYVGK